MTELKAISNKTILVQTTYQPTPHLETEMEIVERLLEQNNTVYWLVCKADFNACFHNPLHEKSICKSCHLRMFNGTDFLKKTLKNGDKLHVIRYDSYLDASKFYQSLDTKFSFEHISELKKHTYKTYDSGMATASSLVSFARDHEPKLENHADFIRRGLQTGAYLYETLQLILADIKPDLVLLFNGRFIENRPLLRLCQQQKIDYATHERGGKIDSFLFRINSIPHSIDTVVQEMEDLWNKATDNKKAIGEVFYKNRIKGVEDAWYSFTKEQQAGRLPASFEQNKDKKIISIFNSSLDEYEGLEGFGPYFYTNDNVGIESICQSLEGNSSVKLYLRVHPNLKGLDNTQNRFLHQLKNSYPSMDTIPAEDVVDTYELIRRSDIIIVFGSTVGIEAAFTGKKVVLLGRASYENLKCFFVPKSHEELIKVLTDDSFIFPEINQEDALKYGYWNESFGYKYQHYKPFSLTNGSYNGVIINDDSYRKKIKRKWRAFRRRLLGKK